MSLAFFPCSRVTTTSGWGEEDAINFPRAPVWILPAGRAQKVSGGGAKKGVREKATAMADDGMRYQASNRRVAAVERRTLQSGPL
jgi:hypothetical protein